MLAKIDFPDKKKNVSLVVGASGGIGRALVTALSERGDNVIALSRSGVEDKFWPQNVFVVTMANHDEQSICELVEHMNAQKIALRLAVIATGVLHSQALQLTPEKRLEDMSENGLASYFAINSIIPGLWLKYLVHAMVPENATMVCVSARVGSISDNKLGGWYGYRASKAALNMLVKTAAVEYGRRMKQPLLVCYHPGTVDTELSAPFQRNVKTNKLFAPEYTANQLLDHIGELNRDENCHFIDWDGKVVTW